jgi:hypothetical protein
MEWLGPTLKPYDLLPKDLGGTASSPAKSATAPTAKPDAVSAPESDSDWHVSFDDLLDVVNPLQHLPVVGTLYRAMTHDQIKTPEKIAGDTLYGGLWGLAGSVADVAFEKLTGHNFGDTVLALFTGHHDDAKPTALASAGGAQPETMVSPQAPAAPVQAISTNESALTASLNRSGADSNMTQRALFAYRRATGLPDQAAPAPF